MGRIIWGIILIGIGMLFFGENMGWLSMGAGEYISRFWPIILVIIGLAILGDVFKSALFRLLIIIVIIGIFALPFIFDIPAASNRSAKSSEASFVLDSAKNLDLSINAGAVEMNIDNQVSSSKAVEASLSSKYLTLKNSEKRRGDNLKVNLSMKDAVKNIFQVSNVSNKFKVHINNSLNINSLELDAGASTINADFSVFKIENIDMNTGATTLNLKFGEKSAKQNISIDSGASTLNIKVPKESGIQLQYDGGLATKSLPDDFDSIAKGLYQSANYGSAKTQLVFDVNLGAATLNITRY